MPYRLQADYFHNESLQIEVYNRKCELQFFSNVDRADESKLCEFPIRFPSVELIPADDQVSVKSHSSVVTIGVGVLVVLAVQVTLMT